MNRPFDFLNSWTGKQVLVLMKGQVQIRGILKAFDVHLNIVLENAEQLEDDKVKIKFGKVMLRGDSIVLITP